MLKSSWSSMLELQEKIYSMAFQVNNDSLMTHLDFSASSVV